MPADSSLFVESLANIYFPGEEGHVVNKVLPRQTIRLTQIEERLNSIPNFPEELKPQATGIANLLEHSGIDPIHPGEGGILALDTTTPEDKIKLGETLYGDDSLVVIIGQNGIIGRFIFPNRTVVIEYLQDSDEPIVLDTGDAEEANKSFLSKALEMVNQQLVIIKTS